MKLVYTKQTSQERRVYHRINCSYIQNIKADNYKTINVQKYRGEVLCNCKRCQKLEGPFWGEEYLTEKLMGYEYSYPVKCHLEKYRKKLYVVTDIGCWMITQNAQEQYILYHKNYMNPNMTREQMLNERYHRQVDRSKTHELDILIKYVVAHDKAKKIIMDDYRKLPRTTQKQKKYYQVAAKKAQRKQECRIDALFALLEAEKPSLKYEYLRA